MYVKTSKRKHHLWRSFVNR